MRAFIDTLKDIRDGGLIAELPAKVQDMVAAVRATQKPARLVITLTLSPLRKGEMLQLEDVVKLTLPEPDRDCTTFVFATDDNELTRRDPRQPSLPGVRGVVASIDRTAEGGGGNG